MKKKNINMYSELYIDKFNSFLFYYYTQIMIFSRPSCYGFGAQLTKCSVVFRTEIFFFLLMNIIFSHFHTLAHTLIMVCVNSRAPVRNYDYCFCFFFSLCAFFCSIFFSQLNLDESALVYFYKY